MKLQSLLERPLIAGASVSADYLAPSPGKTLSLKHTESSKIRVIARNGAPGKETVRKIDERALTDRTALIGVDLFFWDSTHADAAPSLAALDDLMARTARLGLPVILGNVPGILPSHQPSRLALNRAIEEASKKHAHCRILRIDRIFAQAMIQGGAFVDGKHHTIVELLPDGLHLSQVASKHVAGHIEEVMLRSDGIPGPFYGLKRDFSSQSSDRIFSTESPAASVSIEASWK